MTHSTMFQSKILKTKKRLSEEPWSNITFGLCLFIILFSSLFCLRWFGSHGNFGIVPAEIPVVQIPLEDKSFHRYQEQPRHLIGTSDVAIFITGSELYFGDLDAFTTGFSESNNKFKLSHVDGEPQVGDLLALITKWSENRMQRFHIKLNPTVVLVPSDQIPMSIVIQVMAKLEQSEIFESVVLGGGLI